MRAFVTKAVAAIRRDRRLPLGVLVAKVSDNAAAYALARVHLRDVSVLGPRARCFGRPHLENAGRIDIGADFAVSSAFGAVLLATGEAGVLDIGDGVTVNYGTAISASAHVRIGRGVKIGPYCVISDTEVPFPLASAADGPPRPIEIGDDVWLAGRVTVMPGVRIGAGAVVAAGSLVTSDIPERAVASGLPARVLRVVAPKSVAAPAPRSGVRPSHGVEREAVADVALDAS